MRMIKWEMEMWRWERGVDGWFRLIVSGGFACPVSMAWQSDCR